MSDRPVATQLERIEKGIGDMSAGQGILYERLEAVLKEFGALHEMGMRNFVALEQSIVNGLKSAKRRRPRRKKR